MDLIFWSQVIDDQEQTGRFLSIADGLVHL